MDKTPEYSQGNPETNAQISSEVATQQPAPGPQAPVVEPQFQTPPQPQSKFNQLWLVITLVIFLGGFALYWFFYRYDPSQQSTDVSNSVADPIATQFLNDQETIGIDEQIALPDDADRYHFRTFSISLLPGWEAIDTDKQPEKVAELVGNIHTSILAVLMKNDSYILIGMEPEQVDQIDPSTGAPSAYFSSVVSDTDSSVDSKESFYSSVDPVTIQSERCYLSKYDRNPPSPSSMLQNLGYYSSLFHVTPDVSNDSGALYDSFTVCGTRKSGYDYNIIKLTKTDREVTPEPVQREIITMLESVEW